MLIHKIRPQGYCKGVVNALNKTLLIRKENPQEDIYLLNMLVHNKQVMDYLLSLGIKLINGDKIQALSNIHKGIIITSAHGTPSHILDYIKERKLTLIDTTCYHVQANMDIIINKLKEKKIIYLGVKGHPEAEATLSISDNIFLIENIKDLEKLNKEINYAFISQTTISLLQIKEITNYITNNFKNVEIINGQCQATYLRQKAVLDIKEEYDLIIVVGDENSSNGLKLFQLAKNKGNAIYISSYKQLNETIKTLNKIAITSAASTPAYLVEQVINYLKGEEIKELNLI
ncbi:MAG: 4-hydroxy-3-methylbut-2-enyl diphosphate reductase [Bacillales bacterium]|jgi:4-hydroxy-3-methylbut-2-enyl diphosphate reductase|nr:4-hydroxy-3-methylbut-2-enyl diphosphate reductase [Bacillales bacterium]